MGSLDNAFNTMDEAILKDFTRRGNIATTELSRYEQNINDTETRQIRSSLDQAGAISENAVNSATVVSRNATIEDIADEITVQNRQLASDKQSATFARQSEINEWAAQNKLDTLFFLQILFLFFSFVVLLLFLRQYGILPNSVFGILIGVGVLIVVGIYINRALYTYKSRDKRFWNRRYIGLNTDLQFKLVCGQ